MFLLGQTRYIEFRVSDNNENPVTGLTSADFTILFTRNTSPCSDPITLTDNSGGLYTLIYTPSSIGHDYLDLYNTTYDLRIQDGEDIVSADLLVGSTPPITITQNTGGTNTLKLNTLNPQNYTIYIFPSAAWVAGNTSSSFAVGETAVDTAGNWTSSLSVPSGTYHIVAIWNTNQIVIKAYLTV